MDGLDNQCSPSERYSGAIVHDCSYSYSLGGSEGEWRWDRCQLFHRCCVHRSCVLAVHLFIFKHTMESLTPNNGAAANRRYTGQLDDFMKFDCQDYILASRSAAVAELGR
jgi:hypothetical protein